MIPYYSPNLSLSGIIRAISSPASEEKIKQHFSEATGKKHILLTSSCRSALYLAYQSLPSKGVVHTSPLTCSVALQPILASGNRILFHDVKDEDWTIDPRSVAKDIDRKTIAIQAIHLGGFLCDMTTLRKLSDERSIVLIEDCAQAYSSKTRDYSAGTLGDISCFTLTKNVFGIGGGVYATNEEEYYRKALSLQASFPSLSWKTLIYRLGLNFLGSNRRNPLAGRFYQMLKHFRKIGINTDECKQGRMLFDELAGSHAMLCKVISGRMEEITLLNRKRKQNALALIGKLQDKGFVCQTNPNIDSAYTKLFLYHDCFNSKIMIEELNRMKIEAMHLEQKHGKYYQQILNETGLYSRFFNLKTYPVYEKLHDRIVSVPLIESFTEKEKTHLIDKLARVANE